MPPHWPDAPCDGLPAGALVAAEALGLHGCRLQQLGLLGAVGRARDGALLGDVAVRVPCLKRQGTFGCQQDPEG